MAFYEYVSDGGYPKLSSSVRGVRFGSAGYGHS